MEENLTIKEASGNSQEIRLPIFQGPGLLEKKLIVITAHVLTAGALVIASLIALRFIGLLPLWLGLLVGLLLYALTLALAKADDGDEEAP